MIAVSKQELVKIIDDSIDRNLTITTMKKDISELKQDVSGLKQDVSGLKQDVSGLKQDVSGLKQDVSGLKQDVSGLKQELHRQGIIQEEIRDSVKAIAEAVSPLLKKSADMADFSQSLRDHGDQIKLTQAALKGHVCDKSVHLSET